MYASDEFLHRWRAGVSAPGPQPQGASAIPRGHVGTSKPELRVYCRKGHFIHDYRPWEGEDIGALIPGEPRGARQLVGSIYIGQSGTYQATWHPDEAWRELPNVLSVEAEQAFAENGIGHITLTIDDRVLVQEVGTLGMLYHLIERGYLAPLKGYTRPGLPDEFEKTPWYQVLDRNVEIRVDVGYGENTLTTAFKGLIDDNDLGDQPDQMKITIRDFGQVLADCNFFLENISPQLQDPITFADRRTAPEDLQNVGVSGNNDASSYHDGHPPRLASDEVHGDYWQSTAHDKASATVEWIQIRIPAGRYRTYSFDPWGSGYKAYVGLYATARAGGAAPTRNGKPTNVGWQTGGGGSGTVPGPHGGWPYIHGLERKNAKEESHSLGGEFVVGPNSILRLGLQRMVRDGGGSYRVGAREFQATKRTFAKEVTDNLWILVDDVTDIVRVILRWAGFKEWIVESAGIRLEAGKNLVVNRGDHYIDIVKKIGDSLGFVFFMGDPTGPESLGVPTFRQTTALRNYNANDFFTTQPRPVQSVKDYQLLTGIQVKLTDAPLAWQIFMRGGVAKKGGVILESDTSLRYQASYRPPWSTDDRLAGIRKYTVDYNNDLTSNELCMIGCLYAALGQALLSATTIAQFPGNPTMELDDMFYLVDEGTGLATRVWTAQRSWSISSGENAKFTQSMGGALVDTRDIVEIKQAFDNARRQGLGLAPQQIDPAPPVEDS